MQLMYPGFLFGLLAVAIPIVIHLLQLRRPQRLLFTNTAFIREVELVTVRHRNLQQWLLLATRVLGLIGLVLVFCQPFIPAQKSGGMSAGTDVLVDNSFSMQAGSLGQNSLLADAVSQARSMGQKSSSGGQLRLINTGSRLLLPTAYQAALDELKPSAQNPLLKLREEIVSPRGEASALYIFSDFQKKAVDVKTLTDLKNKEVVLVPLVKKASGNLYVDSVWLDDAFVRVRANVGLQIRVRNGGENSLSGAAVKVFLGARQVAAYRVTVEPGQAVTSVVQVQVLDDALALGRVVTEDVPVTFDNTYYFTLQPAAAIRVLEIGAEPVAQQLYSNEPLFNYSFAKPQNVDYGALQRANLVLVREIERIDAGLRDGLRGVVRRGGSVVVVPASTVNSHESYQQLFKTLGLGAVQWEASTAAPELREVAMPSAGEPFFRDVFGAQQRGASMPRVAPVLRWSRTGTDILRLRDGESYLANFASGSGQVYVFSAPFAKQYSDFSAHALFVPVMYRMAMRSYQNEQLPAYRLTQGTLTLKLPAAETASSAASRADEANFRLVKDSVVLIPTQRIVTNELRLDLPMGMDALGFYQVQRGGKVLTTLAFNQDKRESELAAYSAEELRGLIGPNHPNIKVVESGVDGAGLAKYQAEQTGQPLWRYCLLLVLLALLAEALLVRFGSRKAVAPKVAVAA
ncbi:BatA domain-containing protein [Hymenobacter sp. DH14]|uniref:BatA domain-containing protein n=1 Tax=Hymenobacter cyanobacteriorum TaxID=2926463 RepID=A0A9X1VEV5_9BACT|nr:BatA domain-containing protein [Hymenobacter cyanobacteriorum]MCI1186813.1 BatA domain-containing protein [Hymenobacter cyanobacteriorum]